MRLGSQDYVIYDDVVTSDTCSMLSTPYTTSNLMDFMTKQGGEQDMMGLYEVYVVDTKKNIFLGAETVVARTADNAKIKVIPLIGVDTDNDNIEFVVRMVGDWESRKPKEVKIVKEK